MATPLSVEVADSRTPFIRNAWYVLATSAEVTRTPMARTALGTSLVLFRAESGAVVALHNRCRHRSFPLAYGRLEGDTIVCGYHGLRYDLTGRCIEIPMQKAVPSALRVTCYRAIERAPLIWIWMGAAESADESALPWREWMNDPGWAARWAYLYVQGSYVHLHENLLDLSHLSFLHAGTFGTPEYAKAPAETHIEGDDIQVWRRVECELPPIYAKPLGWTGARALRSSGSQYVSPGLHVNTGIFRNLDRPAADAAEPMVKVAQLITPETALTTHYWTMQARNFAIADEQMGQFMIESQVTAFKEDAFALEQIARMHALENDAPLEISIPTDRAGITMRRRLQKLADLEQGMQRATSEAAPNVR
jgi:phenylpropionate dioxygenase-like ring-hydroxylating dioxygenase large terminal subunit